MGLFNRKELRKIAQLEEENRKLKDRLEELDGLTYDQIKEKTVLLQKEYDTLLHKETELKDNIENLTIELARINKEYKKKKALIENFEEDSSLKTEYGIYSPQYPCMNSEEYALKIKEIRQKQKEMIKSKTALKYFDGWVLDGSKSKGRAMNNDNMKMYLRAFNNECDNLISTVKYNNISKVKEKIKKCADSLDKLNERNRISMTRKYLKLKYEELQLVFEYACKKQDEKEAIKQAREEEREIAKAKKELENQKKKIQKEQKHFENAKKKLAQQLSTAKSKSEEETIQEQIAEIENSLSTIDDNLKSLDYREANNKAGYVYIISNIGSFGENVYKIGMTRRLDPQDRIDELSSASVPFRFDVHALIFSENAPALENALHKAFEDKKVNMINNRKEFFRVSLDEIEKVVKQNHEKLIEFIPYAEAKEYRETLALQR